MTVLRVGLQIFHNGVPVQLLYQVKPQVWHVRPLFVEGIDRDEVFKKHDAISMLHTQRAVA